MAAPQETVIWRRRARRGGGVIITKRPFTIPTLFTVWSMNGNRHSPFETTDQNEALRIAKLRLAARGGPI